MQSLDSHDLFASPRLYPEHLDAARKELRFCRMTPESYRQSPFLDHRIVKPESWSQAIPLDELTDWEIPPHSDPVHYIFHSAFCCSTLLTRYLDNLRTGLTLREPHSLYLAASLLRFRGTGILPELEPPIWERSYRFIRRLLARRYAPSDAVFIKPSDGCNNLATDLLSAHPDNRGIFLYSTLERFLVSTLKVAERHEWARIRVRELSLDQMRTTGRVVADPSTLDLPQTVALVWLYHTSSYRRMANSPVGEHLVAVDSQALMEQPETALDKILHHFGVSVERERIAAAIADPDLTIHSKETSMPYSNELREREFQQARHEFQEGVESGLKWASQVLGEDNAYSPLPRLLIG